MAKQRNKNRSDDSERRSGQTTSASTRSYAKHVDASVFGQSRERERMKAAFEQISDWRIKERSHFKEYQTKLKGLGVELRNQGLAAVLANLYSEKKMATIADALITWLRSGPLSPLKDAKTRNDGSDSVFERLLHCDRASYQYLQDEALLFVEELKRFSQVIPGELPKKKDSGSSSSAIEGGAA